MSITCPVCSAWTSVKETRTRKTDGVVTRRYECANLHRFSTEERIRYDEVLQRQLQSMPGLSSPSGENWAAYEVR
jgi:transcriptional regulator NrdR family protein